MNPSYPFQIEIKGIDEFTGTFKTIQSQLKAFSSSLKQMGSSLTFGLTLPIFGAATLAVHDFMEESKALGQVQASLNNVGAKLGLTMGNLQDEASRLQKHSLFGDEEILQKSTAQLLTFGNIGKEVFFQTQQAAVDLATRLNQDLQPVTIAVAKAMNDPIKGVTALRRLGVTFNESQIKMIKTLVKTGQTLQAQRLILKELNAEYSGSAEAARRTDPFKAIMNQFSDLLEDFGKIIFDGLLPLSDEISNVIDWLHNLSPATKTAIVQFGIFLAVLGPAIWLLGLLNSAVEILVSTWGLLAGAAGAIEGAGLAGFFAQMITFVSTLNPWFIALIGLLGVFFNYTKEIAIGLGQGVAQAFGKLGDQFGTLFAHIGLLIPSLADLFKSLNSNKMLLELMRDIGKVVGFVLTSAFLGPIKVIVWFIDLLVQALVLLGKITGAVKESTSDFGKFNIPGVANVTPTVPTLDKNTVFYTPNSSNQKPAEVIVSFSDAPKGMTVSSKAPNVKTQVNTGFTFPMIRGVN